MAENRVQFSSRIGFVLAAAGSAVGLGNIWGFPTQAADNGGAAFLLVYLFLVFLLGYPILCAELLIGRYGQSNPVKALQRIARGPVSRRFGALAGGAGILVVSGILSFYTIVAGWIVAYAAESAAGMLGAESLERWLITFSPGRNLICGVMFMAVTVWVVNAGVKDGIEKWSRRLMPALFVLLFILIGYLLPQKGAMDGLHVYLIPDWSHITPGLFIGALGQSFFSLSLGVGCMMVYGSYVSHKANMPVLALQVTLVDTAVAFLAGLLIVPSMYVAHHNGVEIFAVDGSLKSADTLVFQVLPALFATMGEAEEVVALVFFVLMMIAALTSSISMLEVPVAFVIEQFNIKRHMAGCLVGCLVMAGSAFIIYDFDALFGLVIAVTTRYCQPIVGLLFCLYAGWVWHRHLILEELRQGNPEIEQGLFWKIWPPYVKFVCPLLILIVVFQPLL